MDQNYTISQLFIYPVKGMAGIAIDASFVTQRGLQFDRRWMLVDENNQFISQRSFAILCLFKLEMCSTGFKISYQHSSLIIPFYLDKGQSIQVKIWDDEVTALIANAQINEFFSQHLSTSCRLVYMPETTFRLVDKDVVQDDYSVSFADGYPILIIGQASLNLLNSKLNISININRFRPNIVFTGGQAHQEDAWHNFKIEQVQLLGVKACARCQVPGIDQDTAISAKEPLKTLATYRAQKNKINFGQNVIAKNEGLIRIGDKIEIEN